MQRKATGTWARISLRLPKTGKRIRVKYRADEPWWPDVAAAYWEDELTDLVSVRSSNKTRVHLGPLPGQPGRRCCFKTFLLRNAADAIKHWLRPSRAARAMAHGEKMRAMGFRVPKSYCVIEEAGGASGLIMEAVENWSDARAWLNNPKLGVAGNVREKRRFIRELGVEVGRLHRAGLHHGDMRIGNVLCNRRNGGYSFVWLDNERTLGFVKLPRRLRIHNLAQVNMETTGVTLGDRMRFWREYARAASIPEGEEKGLIRKVAEFTRRRWAENGFSLRPSG